MQFGKACGRAMTEPGSGLYDQQSAVIANQIRAEREAQDYKWGIQHHELTEWLMILAEEVGEVADLLFDRQWSEFPVGDVALKLAEAGDIARKWCEGHDWPERQKQVYAAAKPEIEKDDPDEILPMGSGY